jgi:hypothetical protein
MSGAIRQTNFRDNGGGEEGQAPWTVSPKGAVEALCVGELSWGGQITVLTTTKVEVRTEAVQGCRDRTVFEGSEEDMELVVKAAVAAVQMMHHGREQIVSTSVRGLDILPEHLQGNPRYLSFFAPLLNGRLPAKAALLTAMGVEKQEDVRVLNQLRLQQLAAAWYQQVEEGVSFCDSAAAVQGSKLSDEDLATCIQLTERKVSTFKDLFATMQFMLANKLKIGDNLPDILAMAKTDGIPLLEVVKLLTA